MLLTVEIVGSDPRSSAHASDITAVLQTAFPHVDSHPEGEWTVSVLLSGRDEISRLHGQFFDDPSDTDVMSFPSGDDFEGSGGYLGDIAISLDVATAQAEQQRHSLGRELAYLALHGLLHLLGFRDDTGQDQAEMLAVQDSLFTAWVDGRAGAK